MHPSTLQAIYGCTAARADRFSRPIESALVLCQADKTVQRTAAFLAQIGHESGCLRYVREVWGPTAQQARYEPITTLAGRLGNTEPGDGERYMGRGLIQTTGRENYRMTRDKFTELGFSPPDFEAEPEALQAPLWAALSAGLYWRVKGLNRWADSGDFAELTRRINGGYNGLAHRQALYARALIVLEH